MLIGYARVSTDDQMLDLQRDALKEAGCERIFEDTAGGTAERPNLQQAFSHLRSGDTLVVWRLDRLGRSLKDLIARAEELRTVRVGLKSLKEANRHRFADRATGLPHLRGHWRNSKRALIRETDPSGPAVGRVHEDGKGGGANASTAINALMPSSSTGRGKHTVKQICGLMGISRATLYVYVEEFSKQP